jgi:hypothetical protein
LLFLLKRQIRDEFLGIQAALGGEDGFGDTNTFLL